MGMEKINVGVILAVAMTVIVMAALAASLLTSYQRIPNSGSVKAIGVGVYWDNACTDNVSYIDWRSLRPGATDNRTVYIKNTGDIPIVLSMRTENWDPTPASLYINLTWNREGYVLNTTVALTQAVLILSVSSDVNVTSFNFDIIITGTEHA